VSSKPNFLPGVAGETVLAALMNAAGKELASGKFNSPESSSALAVNAFGRFIDRPHLLPQLPGAPDLANIESVAVEYCARFPWSGGRHPWLDAMIVTPRLLVGVESKRFEPFRDRKRARLSKAYDRPVCGEDMRPFENMRDLLRDSPDHFAFLDAAQLVKHAFGLATDARRKARKAHLHYIYAEPETRAGSRIDKGDLLRHRLELDEFASVIAGAATTFSACSYHEWLSTWRGKEVEAHAARLTAVFSP
jgi:hypothetical protein